MAAGSSMVEALGRLWQVQAPLGSGSSAAVYQVRCVGDPRAPPAAVKEFLPSDLGLLAPARSGEGVGRDYGFRKERAALEELRGHRNIVTLYGVFTTCASAKGPSYCLLLELLDVSVSELLVHSSQHGCSMWITQHCARDILEALAFLHHKGYVHADLKPRNILWSAEEERFKLIDFGLSFKEGNQDVKYIQTDGYRAPEAELQNYLSKAGEQGGTECTAAVDLWSLGIVLLEMVSGMKLKYIVQSQEWRANNSAIIDHIFASKSMVNSAIPAYHLRDLLKSMLHVDQEERATAAKALCSPFFSIPFAPHIEDLVMLPTPVLRLLNILSDTSLQNEEEFEDIVDDIREECCKYGEIISLFVPKENPGKGHVFVEYANAGDSKAAQRALTGKRFDGKFVVATFYPLSAYKRGYLYQTVL
ncbi:serine/threonine-protein kinase Kist [Rhineura floridana]|uniref:serine/threonine-protein kinase Kist n=1 Tax=Rhineura floridana TaxID=261503 RepID=UPI002AC81610|nr:serine/threonine-protein kinase Kist [Rhineura floridana]XP_061440709.1 serine/threonine-protein kinase Kist [Rhineura floridana]XP_061440715.1 serine/threonine-protein kinase Kist [Rhineura floridana]XP_061440724.1 serine/threonine-protein kinase Kist [Rhineura floridana]